jgi:outer membrane protein OmpA-like peptidoglycan-associated protein/tetratricopeptide (TPR) repeat protein
MIFEKYSMMKKLLLLFILTNNFYLITLAQQQVPEKAMGAYFRAKDYAGRTQWEEAITELQYAIKIYPKYTQAKELLGEYYFVMKNYNDAITVLESCVNDKDFTARSTYMLSEIYLKNNNAEKAKVYAEKYLAMPSKVPNATVKAELTVRNANFIVGAKKNPVPFNPKNLGPNINTPSQEYFPYLTPDGKILTFTRMQNNQEDVYIAQKVDSGFAKAVSFGSNINTFENEGAETMNAEGSILFFTSCNKLDGYGSCDIYYSGKFKEEWTDPQGIGKPVNTGAWEAQPSFSSDAKTLYFSSNRPGGVGGRDIWVSYLDENMKFSEPVNLGPNINTKFDDQCPFIHADNQTLYFTSNGWPGMGNADIFISRKTDTGWTKAVNIGYPINTETDDNGMTVSYDGKIAFLSSNRTGGLGGLDIYSFNLPENMQPKKTTYIKAIVKDAKTKQLLNAVYSMTDLESKKEIYKGNSTSGSFFVSIEANKNYALSVQKEGYLFYSQNINLVVTTSAKPYEIEVLLEPISVNSKIVLNNVFFDFDKSDLKTESFIELDKLVDLMQKNPLVRIEVSGHTDNKGDKKYNQILSQKRAESVIHYVVQKGILKSRLVAKGYGDTVPVLPNDTEENKAKNRRTEIKVL